MLLETQLMLLLVSHSPLCLLLFGPLGPRLTLLSALLASSSSLHDITFLLSPTPTQGGGQAQGSLLLAPPRLTAAAHRTSPARSSLPPSSYFLLTSLLTNSLPAHLGRSRTPHTFSPSPPVPWCQLATTEFYFRFHYRSTDSHLPQWRPSPARPLD